MQVFMGMPGKSEIIVEEVTGLKPSGASKFIKLLYDNGIIGTVEGHGKGKYRFL